MRSSTQQVKVMVRAPGDAAGELKLGQRGDEPLRAQACLHVESVEVKSRVGPKRNADGVMIPMIVHDNPT